MRDRRRAATYERIAGTPIAPEADRAWEAISRATEEAGGTFRQRIYRSFVGSRLAEFAGIIVRYVEETQKPDGDRLPGYHDSQLQSLEFRLFSPAPIYSNLEEHLVGGFLQAARQELGADDPDRCAARASCHRLGDGIHGHARHPVARRDRDQQRDCAG